VATTTAVESVPADADATLPAVSFVSQVRHFLWLSSGMFSMSALALAFLEYWTLGPAEQATSLFLAAVSSAALFAAATFLKFGPDEA
jgi:hypothetical protein